MDLNNSQIEGVARKRKERAQTKEKRTVSLGLTVITVNDDAEVSAIA